MKFKCGEKVLVTAGFFAGHAGVVVDVGYTRKYIFFGPDRFLVRLEDQTAFISEDLLEKR